MNDLRYFVMQGLHGTDLVFSGHDLLEQWEIPLEGLPGEITAVYLQQYRRLLNFVVYAQSNEVFQMDAGHTYRLLAPYEPIMQFINGVNVS